MPTAAVLTYHNDNMRTGENLQETILTPANVNPFTFGKVGQVAVQGKVYAQPLYMPNVNIPGQGVHNVLVVATEHDTVYGFDADTLHVLWQDQLTNLAADTSPIPGSDIPFNSIGSEIGITSTPVIDPSTGIIYLVDALKDTSGPTPVYEQQLHALSIATGSEEFGGPVTIQGSIAGRGDGATQAHARSVRGKVVGRLSSQVPFNAVLELQRSGLLLSNGVISISWASYGDSGPYHGWVMGYSAEGLRQVSVLNVTPNGKAGGIWMSGSAPAADANGNIYLAIGNGTFDANTGGRDYGDSLVKLSTRRGLAVSDYFTPYNQAALSANDLDFGSGGVLLLPDQPGPIPHLAVVGGKDGTLYVLNRDNLGHFNRRSDRVVEEFPRAFSGIYSTPAYFNGTVYVVGAPEDQAQRLQPLQALKLVNGELIPSTNGAPIPYGFPGATPSISANGSTNGIVWTLDTGSAISNGPAILRAYAANNVSDVLYDSTMFAARDQAGPAVKFTVPTVANGKVYVGGGGTVTVYGLLPPS
jgi:hypothetical protein